MIMVWDFFFIPQFRKDLLLYPVPIRVAEQGMGSRRRRWAAEVHPQECAMHWAAEVHCKSVPYAGLQRGILESVPVRLAA